MMTSRPLSVLPVGVVESRAGLASLVGDGVSAIGVGVGEGVAVAASSVKVAHGFGSTLAQSLCIPGPSPENGFTCVTKLPLVSATPLPATWVG